MSTLEEIIDKEKSLHTFEVRSSAQRLSELLSLSFREIGASGSYFGHSEVLSHLQNESDWSCETKDWECEYINSETVLVVYKARITRKKSQGAVFSLRSSIWRNEAGIWKMYFHQGTPISRFE